MAQNTVNTNANQEIEMVNVNGTMIQKDVYDAIVDSAQKQLAAQFQAMSPAQQQEEKKKGEIKEMLITAGKVILVCLVVAGVIVAIKNVISYGNIFGRSAIASGGIDENTDEVYEM